MTHLDLKVVSVAPLTLLLRTRMVDRGRLLWCKAAVVAGLIKSNSYGAARLVEENRQTSSAALVEILFSSPFPITIT